MKKIILAMFLSLFLVASSYAQPRVTISEGYYDVKLFDGNFTITLYFNDVDSAETLTATINDMTYFMHDSVIISYDYVASTDDTLTLDFDMKLPYNDGSGMDSYIEFDDAFTDITAVGVASTAPTQNVHVWSADKYGQYLEITVTEKSADSDNDANGTLVIILEPFRYHRDLRWFDPNLK